MRIGELAQATAVSRDTLRFYEERGLIAAQRSANGYRHYPSEMVQLVQFIKTAQRLGFSLNEIGHSVAELWKAPLARSGHCSVVARQGRPDRNPHRRTRRAAYRTAKPSGAKLPVKSMTVFFNGEHFDV